MNFESADPSVVRNIMQRVLLNAWLRAAAKHQPLPLPADFEPGDISGELPDMMRYEVEGNGEDARFVITQEGTRLTAAYGNEYVDPARRTNRYLHDAIGEMRYARVVPSYLACVHHRRPIYSVSKVQDADGKDVSYERLLLPFGFSDRVEHIVGSFKAISLEGGFKVTNLMGLQASSVPVSLVQAVIGRAHGPSAATHSADDVIELE
ncbi:MAG: hypothetical protein AB7I42_03285 [Bradyrhizobium sp.]|uniref:hypothetical protein n=1 Tax=Bradyrhizobium sp. TaxID=376 RepID=UPI0035489F54